MRYELTDLRLFLAIAEASSLTEGAASMHLTSSAASYRLKNLESAMGTALFVRLPRGMQLTPAGEVVNRYARDMFLKLSLMHSEISHFSAGIKGNVRLVANSSSFHGYVIPAISRFLTLHPDINVTVEERSSEAIVQTVLAKEADIGALAGPILTDAVQSHLFAKDELVLITPLHHPLAKQTQLCFEDVIALDFVSTLKDQSHTLFLRHTAQKYGKTINFRLYAQSFHTVIQLVEEGVGIALVPYSIAKSAVAAQKIKYIKLVESWAQRELFLITPPDQKPIFVQVLLDYLLDSTSALG